MRIGCTQTGTQTTQALAEKIQRKSGTFVRINLQIDMTLMTMMTYMTRTPKRPWPKISIDNALEEVAPDPLPANARTRL